MKTTGVMAQKKKQNSVGQYKCGDCANVNVVTEQHTMSVFGKPTLGRCLYYTEGKYCVLLSQTGCEHFKSKN